MAAIVNFIVTKIKELESIMMHISTYMVPNTEQFQKLKPRLYEKYQSHTQSVEKLIDKYRELHVIWPTLSECLEFSLSIDTILTILSDLEEIITDEEITAKLANNMSETYMMNVYRERSSALALINKFRNIYDETTINMFYKHYAGSADKIIENIESVGVPNTISIGILRRLAETLDESSSPAQRNRLIALVDKFKDIEIGTKKIEYAMNGAQYHILQRIIFRHGLTPKTASMSIHDIVEEFELKKEKISFDGAYDAIVGGGGHDSSIVNNIPVMQEVINALEVPAVVIIKTTMQPIEFNLLPLIDVEYVAKHNLFIDQTVGLNDKVLDKYRTVSDLIRPHQDVPIKGGFITNKHAETLRKIPHHILLTMSENSFGFVFESLNGNQVRLLARYDSHKIPLKIIADLIQPVNGRSNAYNRIMLDKITARCYIPRHKTILDEYESDSRTLPSVDAFKNRLLILFSETFDNNFSAAVRGEKSFETFIVDVIEKYSHTIITQEAISFLGMNEKDDESLPDIVTKIDAVVGKFHKRFKLHSSRIEIERDVFNERNRDLKAYLRGVFMDIIFKTIRDLDAAPSILKKMDFSMKDHFAKNM